MSAGMSNLFSVEYLVNLLRGAPAQL